MSPRPRYSTGKADRLYRPPTGYLSWQKRSGSRLNFFGHKHNRTVAYQGAFCLMVEKVTNKAKVLNLLRDKKPHFSAEFRDELGLLEYRKRIMELREDGYIIDSIKIGKRPAYQLMSHATDRISDEAGQKKWEFEK